MDDSDMAHLIDLIERSVTQIEQQANEIQHLYDIVNNLGQQIMDLQTKQTIH